MKILTILILLFLTGCSSNDNDNGGSYINSTIDKNGKFRKGHMRKSVSSDKNAVKNQNRSRYYYETRGKYRRKK